MKNNIFNFKEPVFETNLFLVFAESKKQVKKQLKVSKSQRQNV